MKKIMNFLKPYIKNNKKEVLLYMILNFLLWGIGIFTPYLSGMYIDFLVLKETYKVIVYFILLIIIINLFNIMIQFFTAVISTRLNNKLLHEINNNMFQKVFKAKFSQFKDIDKACLIDQISNDSASIISFFTVNLSNAILQGITIIVSGFIVYKADILLCIIIFTLIPIYILTYLVFRKKLYSANLKYKNEVNAYFSKKAEQINKLEFIKRNVLFGEMYQRFLSAFQLMFSAATSQIKANYLFSNLNQFIMIICYICVIGIGGYKVYNDQLSIGYFTIINTYFSMIISTTSYFLSMASSFQETKVSIDRLNIINDAEDEICGGKIIDSIEQIELCDLGMKYDQDDILQAINYSFKKGKIYAIAGPNGAGKTTLLNTLIGLYSDLYSGAILIDGISIKEADMPNLRREKIAYVEQNIELLNLTIDEYLNFGIDVTKEIIDNRASLIKVFGLDKFSTHINISESGNNYSGGEKQKLSLVRALSKNTLLIILDEPTSALDSESVDKLINILDEQKSERITIIVSHDTRILAKCDDVLNL